MSKWTEDEEDIIREYYVNRFDIDGSIYSYLSEKLEDEGFYRSYDSVQSKVKRMKKNGALETEEGEIVNDITFDNQPEDDEETDLNELYTDKRYVYNEDNGTYVVFFKNKPKPVVIPEQKHKAIVQAYSNWDGEDSTINEITRKFSFLTRELFMEYKNIFGLTHDHEPFSKEELMERDEDDLVDDAYQQKRYSVYKEFEKKKWRETKKDAEKFRKLDVYLREPLEDSIEEWVPDYQPIDLELKETNKDYSLVLSLFDLHLGQDGWADAHGQGYSVEEAKYRAKERLEYVLSKVKDKGRPEEIVCIIGGDFFDIDNVDLETTAGTRRSTDGYSPQIIEEGNKLAINYVDMLRQATDQVKVIVIPGNHDRLQSRNLMHYLDAWYRKEDDVNVDVSNETRAFHQYGNSLIAAEHGRISRNRLAKVIPTEARQMWADTKYSFVFVGDKHHSKVKHEDDSGMLIFQVPTLKGPTDWSKRKAYVSRQAMSAYVFDKSSGLDTIEYAFVNE